MTKPTTILFSDGKTMLLKEVCIMFKAQYIFWEGVKYNVPESWKKERLTNGK